MGGGGGKGGGRGSSVVHPLAPPDGGSSFDASGAVSPVAAPSSPRVLLNAESFSANRMFRRKRLPTLPTFFQEAASTSPLYDFLARLVRSARFEVVSMVVIFFSALHIGLQTDHMARNLLATPPPLFRTFDLIFMFFFLVELVIRLIVFRLRYFTSWGWQWNWLDLGLVVMQVVEEIVNLVSQEDNNPLSSRLLRIVRVMRAVRIVRIAHVARAAEDLRLLVSCVMHSSKSFHWAVALIFLMIYIVGVHITQLTLAQRLELASTGQTLPLDKYGGSLETWYGTVPRSILSLFQGLTGGIDWDQLTNPLIEQLSPWAGFAFAVYMSFALLAVMNVITGTFVQSAMERASHNVELRKVSQARQLFTAIDTKREGTITFGEIEAHLDSPAVQEFFRSIDVDVADARDLFDMLDTQNTGRISFDEFLAGCMRLHGPAKALDLVLVMRELKGLHRLSSSTDLE